jgi:hypothetical protein
MRFFSAVRIGAVSAVLSVSALAQTPRPPAPTASELKSSEAKGIPPRATPADYQTHATAGTVTIAAEFMGHAVPTPEQTLSSEDYVVVETGFFGPAEARLNLSSADFALRINGKKSPTPSAAFELVAQSVKDPEWQPPEQPEAKSKGGLSTGGRGKDDNSMPVVIHVPIELRRAMALRVQKASLPQGDRPLPQAGLIYFQYRGQTKSIHSVELIYSGAAGSATLALQP